MNRINRFVSLIVALLMLAAAAIAVNRMIFGHSPADTARPTVAGAAATDTITVMPDGSRVVHTALVPGTIEGYAGAVPLDIRIADGKVAGVTALPNGETTSFFERATAVLDSWTGLTPAEAVALKVDGVTGATYSSEAIINNVGAGLDYYIGTEARHSRHTPWKLWVALAVVLAACVVPVFVHNKIYRTVQLVANVAVLGFWCGQFLDYSLMLKYMSHGISLPAGLVAVAMLMAAFVYPLFCHSQHYCMHICPLGSAQQLVAEVCHYKIKLSHTAVNALDRFRRALWAALMLALWTDCLTGWMDLELFRVFRLESAQWYIIAAACLFVALSAIVARPYCRFVCPTGSLFKRAENIG